MSENYTENYEMSFWDNVNPIISLCRRGTLTARDLSEKTGRVPAGGNLDLASAGFDKPFAYGQPHSVAHI